MSEGVRRRDFLRGALAAALVTAGTAPGKSGAAQESPGAERNTVPLPKQGVKAEFGFRTPTGLIVQFERAGGFRDRFDANLVYFFPNQQNAVQVTDGIQQSTSGSSAVTSSTRVEGEVITTYDKYNNRLRAHSGHYTLQGEGDPRDENGEWSLECPEGTYYGGTGKENYELEPLTREELATISDRVNNGQAYLYKSGSSFEDLRAYELPGDRILILAVDYADLASGRLKAFLQEQEGTWTAMGGTYHDPRDPRHPMGAGYETGAGFLTFTDDLTGDARWHEKLGEDQWSTAKPARRLEGPKKNSALEAFNISNVAGHLQQRATPSPCDAGPVF